MPMAISSGAGANARHAIGTGVIGGMVFATFIGLLPAHIIYCWIGASLNDILVDDPNPNLQSLFAEFMWPLLGVAFLSMLLPLTLKLVQKWRARHGMDAA